MLYCRHYCHARKCYIFLQDVVAAFQVRSRHGSDQGVLYIQTIVHKNRKNEILLLALRVHTAAPNAGKRYRIDSSISIMFWSKFAALNKNKRADTIHIMLCGTWGILLQQCLPTFRIIPIFLSPISNQPLKYVFSETIVDYMMITNSTGCPS